MYQNYKMPYRTSDRFIGGGFLGPFILGGITGALVSPGFNRPVYYPPYPVYPYYPCPYCR